MTATADTPSDTPSTMSTPDSSTQQPAPAPVSGPSATPSVASVPVSTPTETAQNEIDPAVAPLVAMFPDFDPNVLEAVYLSNNRDQNAAIEALLSMSNPEYQPSAEQVQSDADEQLARQLEQEELSHARAAQAQAPAWPAQQQQVPRQPSSRSPGAGPAQEGPGGDNLQEQLNKFAETGKRTFNTIFTKVKEKLKELDQPSNSQQQGSSYGQYQQQHPQTHQGASPPQVGYTPMGSSPPHAININPPAASPPATASVRAYAPQAGAPAQSYLPEMPSDSPPNVTEQPAPKAPPVSTASTTGGASSGGSTGANVPELSGNRPSLDLSKAAFLAKKPTPLTERPVHNIDDDLTENPFEDHKP